MLNRIKKNTIEIYTILNILFIFITSYLRVRRIIGYENFGNYIHIATSINILVITFIIIKKIRQNQFEIKLTDLLLLFMLLFGIISTVFAYDITMAILGCKTRYEGIIAISYYLSLAYITSYVKNKKMIINAILITGIVQTIYAICQVYKIGNVMRYVHSGKISAIGFINNPNFYGTYVLLCLLYAVGLYYDSKEIKKKIIYVLSIILFMIGLLLSNATSCAVGLIVVYIYILIYSIKKKEYKKFLCLTLIIILTTLIIFKTGKTTLIRDINKTSHEVSEMAKGNFETQFGTNRIGVWKITIKYIPKHLLHGIGVDNFEKILDGRPIKVGKWFFDKAHNEYLQILITEGIFCLTTYLLFYAILVIKGIKNSFKDNKIYLVLPIIGYLVQAFFNISVIDVAPIFWIGIGLLTDRNINKNNIN